MLHINEMMMMSAL